MEPQFLGQIDDCKEMLRIIEDDLAAYLNKDFEGLSRFFLKEERFVSIMQIAGTGLIRSWGYDQFEKLIRAGLGEVNAPSAATVSRENIRIIAKGDMGWASFDQYISESADATDPPDMSHNIRVFERHEGEWLIAFHGTYEPSSAGHASPGIEVDEYGTVLSMNAAAVAQLGKFSGLTISAGKLRAVKPSLDKTLRKTITRAAELRTYSKLHTEIGRGNHLAFPVVLGEDDEGATVVCQVEVTDFSVWVTFDDEAALDRRLAIAQAIYGLSDTQARLVKEIANGADLKTAADTMGVTINTTRTHMRRLFDKTGVRSQPALLRVILSLG